MNHRSASRLPSAWILTLTSGYLLIVGLTYGDYGITWDESVQAHYGELVVDYFLSGLRDTRCNEFLDLRYYGALFESFCAAVYRMFDTHPFETRHLLTGLAAVLTLPALMLTGRLWRDPWVAAFAGPLLLLLPRFVGHAVNNSKDIPFACAFAWAMYAICRLLTRETVRRRDFVVCGLAIGMTLSMRVGGLLLFGFLAAGWAARWALRGGTAQFFARPLPGLVSTALLAGIAWVVMIAGWPWAHADPILHPIEALGVSTDFAAVKLIRFGGELINSQDMPRSYLPWYLTITTPLPALLLAAAGFASVLATQWKHRESNEALIGFLLQLWLLFPIVYVVAARPVIYDGIRHFLFVLPAVALLAAIGAVRLRTLLPRGTPRTVATLVLAVLVLLPLRDLIVLHPYQSSYFNSAVGGVGRAWPRYDADYWLSSYKEAAGWLNARSRERPDRPLRVLLAGNRRSLACATEYLSSLVQVRTVNTTGIPGEIPQGVDYYVSTTRRGLDENFPGSPIVHTIQRDGGVFTVIRAR